MRGIFIVGLCMDRGTCSLPVVTTFSGLLSKASLPQDVLKSVLELSLRAFGVLKIWYIVLTVYTRMRGSLDDFK